MIYQFENYDLKIKWDPKEKMAVGKGKDPDKLSDKFLEEIEFPWFNPIYKGRIIPPEPILSKRKLKNEDDFSSAVYYIALKNNHSVIPVKAF